MKFEITIIEDDRVSTQDFDAIFWPDALDKFVSQLKMMGWLIPKEYIRIHDFESDDLTYSQNITQGFDNAD